MENKKQFGDLTPDEIERLKKFKNEMKEREGYPREYFKSLAVDFLQIGDKLCAMYQLPHTGPLSALRDNLHDYVPDPTVITNAKALFSTIRNGETLQEYVLRRDREELQRVYGDDVQLGLSDDNFLTKGIGIVGANFINIPIVEEELKLIDIKDVLRISNSIAISYALTMGFLTRENPFFKGNDNIFIPEQYFLPPDPITLRHPSQPITMDVNLFDAYNYGYEGIMEYPNTGIAVEGIVIRYSL